MREHLKDLFAQAIELAPQDRDGFLARACSGDALLRDHLSELLRAHDDAGDFLDYPAGLVAAAARDVDDVDDLVAGQKVGAFTLRECLGRGGFGSVWRASQEQPVMRDVALKLLHGTFDAERQLEQFLAECRALARMQHPSIARVFEAGAEPSGRLWLAMELIEGQPITRHCAAGELGWRARVELLQEACGAIQHAHQKGIVHRDLKPSNVLVTMRDGRAHPVVIDFGVARDLHTDGVREVDEPTLLGTIEYMSPEQAGVTRLSIDTRTDVHALGVLLYELLAGARPFAKAPGEVDAQPLLRRIREEPPPPPSTRAGALPRLPREVDWIVACALSKDPDARYQTAAALGDDLRRLVAGEAVVAGSPTKLYRCRKFARRNWLPVTLSVALMATLVVGAIVAARGWIQASASADLAQQAERRARADQLASERESRKAKRALDLFEELWQSPGPARLGRADYPVRELLDDFERNLAVRVAGEPEVELRIRLTLARIQRILGVLDRADEHAARAITLARETGDRFDLVAPLLESARTQFDRGDMQRAEASGREALAILDGVDGDDDETSQVLGALANCRQRLGDVPGALEFAERALALRRNGPPGALVRSLLQLANVHGTVGRTELAMDYVRQALDGLRGFSPEHPDAINALQHLAILQQSKGDSAAAEASFRESLQRRRKLFGDEHPQVAWAEVDLAWLLHEQQRDAEALPLVEHALPILRQRLGENHLYVSEATQRLGAILIGCGRLDEGGVSLRDAVTRYRTLPGHTAEGLVACLQNLGGLQWMRGERDLARATLTEALQIARRDLPRDHYVASVAMTNLSTILGELGEVDAAIELLEEALARSTAAGRTGEVRQQRERLEALRAEYGRR